ncbi:hypothetical protein AgCh_007278 [Apium graveolens]
MYDHSTNDQNMEDALEKKSKKCEENIKYLKTHEYSLNDTILDCKLLSAPAPAPATVPAPASLPQGFSEQTNAPTARNSLAFIHVDHDGYDTTEKSELEYGTILQGKQLVMLPSIAEIAGWFEKET